MSKQHIPPRKKYALWIAHKRICHYCKEPLLYQDMWVDHILPEHLSKAPDKLEQILREYELVGLDFDIKGYSNWLPAHWRCNLDKGGSIFDKGAARYYINIARAKAKTAQREEQKIIHDLKRDKLLGSLDIALSEGLLSQKAVFAILEQYTPTLKKEPIIITFGLNYYDLWENDSPPDWLSNYEPSDYPHICNLLEKNLVEQLKWLLSCDFFYPEASNRNGETLSVRLAFVQLDENEMSLFKSEWWEILEFTSYPDVYGEKFNGAILN